MNFLNSILFPEIVYCCCLQIGGHMWQCVKILIIVELSHGFLSSLFDYFLLLTIRDFYIAIDKQYSGRDSYAIHND